MRDTLTWAAQQLSLQNQLELSQEKVAELKGQL